MSERGTERDEDDRSTRLVVAAVIKRDGRYLVCQRAAGKRHGGLWEFPGGKLEAHETFAEAATRELEEELGLKAVKSETRPLFFARDPNSPFVVAFLVVLVEGDPTPYEHQAIAWCTPEELSERSLAPTDRRFVEETLLPSRDLNDDAS